MARKEQYVVNFWTGVLFTIDEGSDPKDYVDEHYEELLEEAREQIECYDDELQLVGYVEE